MSDKNLKDLERRFEAALARVTTALSHQPVGDTVNNAADGDGRIGVLQAENTKLRADLEKLKAERDQDLAELDQLISQLKPLLDEVA